MAKFFVSFTSTFESLLQGKLSPASLSEGTLVFGCKKEHVLVPYDQVPVEVLLNNKCKPNVHTTASIVNRKSIDVDVLEMWDHFAAQIRKANLENRLLFMHKIGHPSYRHFSQDAVDRGDDVFWKGSWVQPEHRSRTAKIYAEIESKLAVPLPDRAFIDQILAEAASTASIQGYTHG